MNFWKEYIDRKTFLASAWIRLAQYQVFGLLMIGLLGFSMVGCAHKAQITGGQDEKTFCAAHPDQCTLRVPEVKP